MKKRMYRYALFDDEQIALFACPRFFISISNSHLFEHGGAFPKLRLMKYGSNARLRVVLIEIVLNFLLNLWLAVLTEMLLIK